MTLKIKNCEIQFTVYDKNNLVEIMLPAICVIGRSNAGKSSFINTIVEKKRFAYTSSKPGKTRSLNFYLINNQFYLVDFPGYGYGAISDLTKKGWNDLIDSFFNMRKIRKYIFFLIDCRRKPDEIDYQLIEYIKINKIPIL
ncbi:MAG: ribosome biogenesis GTP-binding protein YihA/YsxC, partial [Exilispira sp.]